SQLTRELEETQNESNQLKESLENQRTKALTDPLTKLPNRQAYDERLSIEYRRWRRYNTSLSLIMGDIDLFKDINDKFGHITGDVALRETAKIFTDEIRETDFVARFGGEEFIILMPETNLTDAVKAVNKIRKIIKNNPIQNEGDGFQLTMSFGVAAFAENDTCSDVLSRADKAMYRAKKKGRDQVCVQRKET
ncbi:MAG: GGDEF domain-containing protein, partial [Gammaproteobacteria bacterium]